MGKAKIFTNTIVSTGTVDAVYKYVFNQVLYEDDNSKLYDKPRNTSI